MNTLNKRNSSTVSLFRTKLIFFWLRVIKCLVYVLFCFPEFGEAARASSGCVCYMNAPHYPYHLIVIVVVIIITIIIIIYCHYLFSERCTGIVDARVRIPASLNSFQVFFSRLYKLRRYLRWCSLHLFLDNTVPIYKFSYILYFIFSFPGYITNKFTDQFLVSLLAQLFRALHQYRRCQGLNPGKSDFLGFLFATA